MIKVGVTLQNGSKHTVVYENNQDDWKDLVKFSRDSFVKDTEDNYILVSNISVFKFEEKNG
jgi:hypothetical protein